MQLVAQASAVACRRRAVEELPTAELPLTVQLVSVSEPPVATPPPIEAELPLMVQLVSVAVPVVDQAAADSGGVAADGAVGQRGRAACSCTSAAAAVAAELPLTVQFGQRRRAVVVDSSAAAVAGGVAADGAVGQRGRAASVDTRRRRRYWRSCR